MTQDWMSLMSPSFDLAQVSGRRRRYAILSTPRCGSTLLGMALTATGRLGVPTEYLNSRAIAAFKALGGEVGLDPLSYLDLMEARRTASSGWFGIKIHLASGEWWTR